MISGEKTEWSRGTIEGERDGKTYGCHLGIFHSYIFLGVVL